MEFTFRAAAERAGGDGPNSREVGREGRSEDRGGDCGRGGEKKPRTGAAVGDFQVEFEKR